MEIAFAPVTSDLLGDHCSIRGLHFSTLGLRYWLFLLPTGLSGYRFPPPSTHLLLLSLGFLAHSALWEPVAAPELLDRRSPAKSTPWGTPEAPPTHRI